jgi:hypothetical protein
MGGGGGSAGSGMPDRVLQVLTETAKRELAKAAAARRNVFISFAFDDINEVTMLRGQALNESSALEFSDRSVREPFDERTESIEQGIRDKIRQSSVTVCVLTDNSAQSKWVNWEIEESLAMGKGVVGMYLGSAPPRVLPPAVRAHQVELVPWKHDALMSAIERAARQRSGADRP